jgi:hypothetical protein
MCRRCARFAGREGDFSADCRSVRLRSRFLLNSFWRQLLTHYKARTEALCESIEKSPIDMNGSKARGTFVAQFVEDRLAVQR